MLNKKPNIAMSFYSTKGWAVDLSLRAINMINNGSPFHEAFVCPSYQDKNIFFTHGLSSEVTAQKQTFITTMCGSLKTLKKFNRLESKELSEQTGTCWATIIGNSR